ncbi:Iron-sulfur assembly protein 1 [Madurella mycetomatis]|uniref:Iron-sulfur assembly protein 1 n=1 Tax=Madurella mycetomatis TaxID=100816 RepID=A0A175WHM4_9PEZI|nr:Iron-sulfur assembly protein 1 [Madurella mycetomatis]
MNAPSLLTRRSVSVCLACRRSLLRQRQFSTTPPYLAAAFQAYTLPSQPPATPRNASVPETSIAHPVQSPPPPRVNESRPSKQTSASLGKADGSEVSIPEKEAQQSKSSFAVPNKTSTTSTNASSASSAQPNPSASESASTSPATAQSPQQPAPRPRSRLRTPRKAAMKLTPAAVEHVRRLLDQPEPKLIKVGVRNRGCSGLAYNLEYVDKAGAFDETVEQDGVKVLIDSKALFSIIGSEMDWVEDKLSQRFVFRNPNIKEQCGCGESFMV